MSDEERNSNSAQLEAQMEGFQRLADLVNLEEEAWGAPGRSAAVATRVNEWVEERAERESEGILSVEFERTVRIVLCTGGPHCEIVWPENGNPSVVCYGWFGSDRVERNLNDDEIAAVERCVYGLDDFDELAAMIGRR